MCVLKLHVASCSVEYSVDELHCCALSTGLAKGEQLSTHVHVHVRLCYLNGTTGYAKRERKQVRLSRSRASDRALTVGGPQGNYIIHWRRQWLKKRLIVLEHASYSLHVYY